MDIENRNAKQIDLISDTVKQAWVVGKRSEAKVCIKGKRNPQILRERVNKPTNEEMKDEVIF